MFNNTPITTIILSGGQSSRFGKNKALEKINNLRIIEYVYNSVKTFSDEILISSNTNDYNFLPVRIIKDKFDNIGPISGIYSSLLESNNEINLITTCDTPLLNQEFFEYLLTNSKNFDISNPIHNNITEPIIGVFIKSVTPIIEGLIKIGITSPPKIFKQTKSQFININSSLSFYHKEMFRNVNTKEDLVIVRKMLEK